MVYTNQYMKNYIFSSLVAGLLIGSSLLAVSAQGAAAGDVDPGSSQAQCLTLTNTNLRLRARDVSTNGEVSLLQGFLQDQGLLSADPTGYFGTVTLAAVNAFQTRNGITPASGYVGALTRAKIQEISCGTGNNPNVAKPTITVTRTNPNLSQGQTQTLSWSTTNATSLTAYCAGAGSNANKTIPVPLQQAPFTITWAEYRSQGSSGAYTCTWTATGTGGVTTYQETSSVIVGTEQVCTADAMVCPNGTTVGRTGPNCTFAACPSSASLPSITAVSALASTGRVTIAGANLSGTNLRVFFAGTQVGVVSANDTQVVANLPQTIQSGQVYSVYVSNDRGTSNTMTAQVLASSTSAPVVTASVTPTTITAGGTFTELTYTSSNAVYCDWYRNDTKIVSRGTTAYTWNAANSGGPYNQTTKWTFICYNANGQASAPANVTLTVTGPVSCGGGSTLINGSCQCSGNMVLDSDGICRIPEWNRY